MLLACRNICQAWDFARRLEGDDAAIHQQVEQGKKRFVGFELEGRTLGVIGLGAIGIKVANTALRLGMQVVGFDPEITVQSAWQLSSEVKQASSVEDILTRSDFVTLHVPLVDSTQHMINRDRVKCFRQGAVLLNFARHGIVDDEAVIGALDSGRLHAYVCDFANNRLKNHPRVIALPHLISAIPSTFPRW